MILRVLDRAEKLEREGGDNAGGGKIIAAIDSGNVASTIAQQTVEVWGNIEH